MKKLLLILMACSVALATNVSGVLRYSDNTNFQGTVTVSLARPSVSDTCTSPVQVVAFRTVAINVVNGVVPTTALYPSDCLQVGTSQNATAVAGAGAGSGYSGLGVTGKWYGSVSVVAGADGATNAVAIRIGLSVPPLLTCYADPVSAWAVTYNDYPVGMAPTVAFSTGSSTRGVLRFMSIVTGTTPLLPGAQFIWGFHCVQPYSVAVADNLHQTIYQAQWVVPVGTTANITAVDYTQIRKLK